MESKSRFSFLRDSAEHFRPFEFEIVGEMGWTEFDERGSGFGFTALMEEPSRAFRDEKESNG